MEQKVKSFLTESELSLTEQPYMVEIGKSEPLRDYPSELETCALRRKCKSLPDVMKDEIDALWIEFGILLANVIFAQARAGTVNKKCKGAFMSPTRSMKYMSKFGVC